MITDNKPYLNHELSFTAYDKEKLETFIYPSRMPKQEIVKSVDTLLKALNNYKPSPHSEYNVYYSNYHQNGDQVKYGTVMKSTLKTIFERTKHILLTSNSFSNDDVSSLDHYYFIYSCIAVFKTDWPLNPDFSFSNDL